MKNKKKYLIILLFLGIAFGVWKTQGNIAYGQSLGGTPSGDGWDVGNLSQFGLPESPGGVYGIIQAVLFWLLGIFSFIAIIGFVISGLMYIFSGGDDNRMQTAKKMMINSIIGVVIGMSGLIIISAIDWALRGSWWF